MTTATPSTDPALENRNALHIDVSEKQRNNGVLAGRIMAMIPLAPGARVLEAGCGGAELSAALMARFGLDCVGLEPFPMYAPAIDAARVTRGRVEALPWENDRFDLVIAKDVVEHVDDVDAAVAELVRVSRKYVYITNPNYLFPYEAHFKVPYPPLIPKSVGRLWLRALGVPKERIGFLEHINYVTRPGLLRSLRRMPGAERVEAVIDLQRAKRFRHGVLASLAEPLINDKIELLVVKRDPAETDTR